VELLTPDLERAAYDILAQARYEVRLKTPYFQRLTLSMPIVLSTRIRTTAVTRKRVLLVNPHFITKQNPLQAGFCYVHEGLHVYGDYFVRAEGKDPKLANISHDLWINQQVLAMGYEAPAGIGIYLPEQYGFPPNLTMEEYYDLLLLQPPKPKGKNKKKEEKEEEEEGENTDPSSEPSEEGSEEEGEEAESSDEEEEEGIGAGACGGGAGHSEDEEAENELDQDVGRTDVEWQVVVEKTREDIQEYERKGFGTVPGSFAWEVKAAAGKSRIPWERKMRANTGRLLGQIQWGQNAFSRKRISKRSFLRNETIPGMVDYPVRLGIVLDTSGSMFELLAKALREIVSIFTGLGISSAVLIQGDAGVADIKEVQLRDLYRMQIKGGGGTNFEPVIARARELRPKLDLLTYVTDGDGNCGPQPRDLKLQWVILASGWSRRPPWGPVVVVREDGHEDDFPGLGD